MESLKKVLIVDDEKNIRELLQYDFASSGYEVESAESGQEGLEKFKKDEFQAVVTDLRMAGGGGFELLRQIRSTWPARKPVVIVITGFGDVTVEQAFETGADGFFTKPFRRRVVVSAVSELLKPAQERLQKAPEGLAQTLRIYSNDSSDLFKKVGLGRGGLFIPFQEPFPEVGHALGFELICKDLPEAIKGAGKVNWVRKKTDGQWVPGLGLEFLFLSPFGFKFFSDNYGFQKRVEFIPRGL